MRNRYLLCLLTFFLLIQQDAFAQQRRRRGRSSSITMGSTFGVKIGASFSSFSGSGTTGTVIGRDVEYSYRTGLVAGGLYNYRFDPAMSLQLELLYGMAGFNRSVSGSTLSYDDNVTLGYVQIPVMFKYNANIFYGEAGLVGGILATTSVKSGFPGAASNPQSLFSPYDVGIGLGIGVEAPNGFIMGLRFIRGMVEAGSKDSQNPLYLSSTKGLNNSSFQVTAGYIFNHSSGRRRH